MSQREQQIAPEEGHPPFFSDEPQFNRGAVYLIISLELSKLGLSKGDSLDFRRHSRFQLLPGRILNILKDVHIDL